MLPVDKHTAYELLRLLDVQRFNQARGKYVVVLREDAFGFIKGIKRLPCDPPCELILGDNNE